MIFTYRSKSSRLIVWDCTRGDVPLAKFINGLFATDDTETALELFAKGYMPDGEEEQMALTELSRLRALNAEALSQEPEPEPQETKKPRTKQEVKADGDASDGKAAAGD